MTKPIQRFQSGPVSASIFEKDWTNPKGTTVKLYSISIEKLYTKADGTKANTTSFDPADLPKVMDVAKQAKDHLATLGVSSFANRETDRDRVALDAEYGPRSR